LGGVKNRSDNPAVNCFTLEKDPRECMHLKKMYLGPPDSWGRGTQPGEAWEKGGCTVAVVVVASQKGKGNITTERGGEILIKGKRG